MTNQKTVNILGIPFINQTYNQFMKLIEARINKHQNTFVETANPEIVMYAKKHPSFKELISHADYITPDGIGIVKASKSLKQPMPDRISGYDIFKSLLSWGNQNHKSAYFIGAKPQVNTEMKIVVESKYPNLVISGFHDGYFKNPASIMHDIKKTQPDMVFIAMGYPKQENLINKYKNINNGLWIGVGGSFDVMSGIVHRAPKFWINHHIEWLYRLIKEPSRLPRMLALPEFVLAVRKQAKENKQNTDK